MYVCMYVCVWVGMQHSLLFLPTVMDTGRGSRSIFVTGVGLHSECSTSCIIQTVQQQVMLQHGVTDDDCQLDG